MQNIQHLVVQEEKVNQLLASPEKNIKTSTRSTEISTSASPYKRRPIKKTSTVIREDLAQKKRFTLMAAKNKA